MKKLIALIILLASVVLADHNAQKFKVTYTITFNELTLQEASRLEKVIKQDYSDACEIDVSLEKVTNQNSVWVRFYWADTIKHDTAWINPGAIE